MTDIPSNGLKAIFQRNPVMATCAGLLILVLLLKLTPGSSATSDEQRMPAPSANAPSSTSDLTRAAGAQVDPVVGVDTRCSAAIRYFDDANRQKIAAVDKYVQDVMREQDRMHVRKGERSVIAGLNSDGFVQIRTMAVTFCRQDPSSLLQHAAAEAYDGTRKLQNEFGIR